MTNKRQEALRRFLNEHPEFTEHTPDAIIHVLESRERNESLKNRLRRYQPVNSVEMDDGCFYINPKPACP